MMIMTTQGYMLPSLYETANMFAQPASRNPSKVSKFPKMFCTESANSRTVEPQQTEKHASRVALGALNTDESSFSFDSPSPFQQAFSTPGTSELGKQSEFPSNLTVKWNPGALNTHESCFDVDSPSSF